MIVKSFILTVLLSKCVFAESRFTIGGLFYQDSDDMKAAFTASGKIFNFATAVREVTKRGEVLKIREHVCSLASEGAIGIIDGLGGRASPYIQAICDELDLPHVIVDHNDLFSTNWSCLSIHPSPAAYNMILKDLVTIKEWTNFTILYVKGHSLLRVTSLLEMASKNITVSVRELSGLDYRDVLINCKENSYVNFVVDCPSNKLEQLLKHAQQVSLMADEHSYIFLSSDLFTIDLTRYRYGGVNMTGLQMVNLTDDDFIKFHIEFSNELPGITADQMKTRTFLIYDAVKIFAEALNKMPNISVPEKEFIDCDNFASWEYGASLLNFMRSNRKKGLTDILRFDGDGQRSEVKIDVLELTPAGSQLIGNWDTDAFTLNRPFIPSADLGEESLMRNKTYKVLISKKSPPYTYLTESYEKLDDNARFEGFAVDVFEKLSEMLGFNYILDDEPNYGSYNFTTGETTGMVHKIQTELADFGICDFTITTARQHVIDFSTPFMSTGIGILYKKPSKQPPEMFSFMQVFSKEVWYYMIFIQLSLGVVMIIVGRLSHKEWQNPVPCIEDPDELSNQFSFANSVWLIIGSVMQQGSEIAPIAFAPRMVTSVWWFFTMIMVATYVGALVAVLTIEKNVYPFTNVKELYEHKSIAYGAKSPGSTLDFFKDSNNSMYNAMYAKMIKKKWTVIDNNEGVARCENEEYAFLAESTAIEYFMERHCDLIQVGDLLDSKSYGIGMRKNVPYKKDIDRALLKLKESGELQRLKDLWWKEKRGGGLCGQEEEEEQSELGMKNMQGVFVVLGVGSAIGIVISILDMLWGVFKRSVKYNTTFKEELIEELKFALKFSGDVKPVKRPQSTDDSAEALADVEAEGKDEIRSLRSALSGRSTDTHRTCHSHSSRHSSLGLSVAFARRREYT